VLSAPVLPALLLARLPALVRLPALMPLLVWLLALMPLLVLRRR